MIRKDIINHRCGHSEINQYIIGVGDEIEEERFELGNLCYNCRHALIGTRQLVVRYGLPPASGRSHNYATGRDEIGISCYYPDDRPRPEFASRKRYQYIGTIVGYGGDDEPLATDLVQVRRKK